MLDNPGLNKLAFGIPFPLGIVVCIDSMLDDDDEALLVTLLVFEVLDAVLRRGNFMLGALRNDEPVG